MNDGTKSIERSGAAVYTREEKKSDCDSRIENDNQNGEKKEKIKAVLVVLVAFVVGYHTRGRR